MENSNKMLYKRLLVRAVLAVVFLLFIVVVLPQVIKVLFPFILAFLVAVALNPVVNKINEKLGISRRVIAIILDLLVFLFVASLIGLLVYAVVSEAVTLANYLQLNWDSIAIDINSFDSIFVWFGSFLPPQIMDLLEGFEETITSFLQNSGKRLLGSLLTATTTLTTTTGNFFVNFIMAILASYFMISDYTRIMSAVKTFIGRRIGNYVTIVKSSALKALAGFVRSQLLLALFAFVCMFISLIAVRQPYALLIALFLAFVDLLPIVGTIAVLIPWGLFELAAGNINKSIYLLCIGIAFFLIRKVVEPKIVGSQTGLHPLAALLSTFIGLQFSGVWGAILGPVVLMMAISIYKTGIFDSTVSDVRSAVNNLALILKSK